MAKKTNANTTPPPTFDPELTLHELSERYLYDMASAGKSLGTCFSYGMELRTAQAELGQDTRVWAITPELIAAFNTCERVMKLRSGKPKAEPSYLKTRRVLRLALNWAAQTKLIPSSPCAAPLAVSQAEAERAADEVEPTLVRTPDLTVVVGDTIVTDGTSAPEAKKRARKSKAAAVSESSEPSAA